MTAPEPTPTAEHIDAVARVLALDVGDLYEAWHQEPWGGCADRGQWQRVLDVIHSAAEGNRCDPSPHLSPRAGTATPPTPSPPTGRTIPMTENQPSIHDRLEAATGLNGDTLTGQLADQGLAVVDIPDDAGLTPRECPHHFDCDGIRCDPGVSDVPSSAPAHVELEETITDPAEIRATSDERGCCDCRTFDQHERECILPDERECVIVRDEYDEPAPFGSCSTHRRALSSPVALGCATPAPVGAAVALDLDALGVVEQWLDDDEEMRIPGNEWGTRLYEALKDVVRSAREPGAEPALVSEVRRLTEENANLRRDVQRAGDHAEVLHDRVFAARVSRAEALDLDAARAMLNAANTIKATGGAVEIGGVRMEPCDEYGSTVTTARAESAEAEVGTLRAKVAAVEAVAEEWDHREYVRMPEDFAATIRAALATGEGQ